MIAAPLPPDASSSLSRSRHGFPQTANGPLPHDLDVMYRRRRLVGARIENLALIGAILVAACSGSGTPAATDAGVDATSIDASVAEPCATANAMRSVACGNCGMRIDICTAGAWTQYQACSGEGVCAAGTMEEVIAPDCSRTQRTCSATCTWSAFSNSAPPATNPACTYGDSKLIDRVGCAGNLGRFQVCDATCQWSATTECGGGCAGTRRVSPPEAEEICIPGGKFVRGDPFNTTSDNHPSYQVSISPFYLDRYPVTWRRYQQCVDAGACTPVRLQAFINSSSIAQDDTHPDSYIATATFDQSEAFCRWDGGRRLPTAAEWEKAARGPAPSTLNFPWGTGSFTSFYMPASQIDGRYFRFDAYPESASYFGVELMLLDSGELSSDFATGINYPPDTGSVRDPQVTMPVTMYREARGSRLISDRIGQIPDRLNTYYFSEASIRCSRSDH